MTSTEPNGPLDQDPGWGPAIRLAPTAFLPVLGHRRLERTDGLIGARILVLAFALSLAGIALVVGFLANGGEPPDDPLGVGPAFGLLGAAAVLSVGGSRLVLRSRPLSLVASDPTALAELHRTRMFLRVALGNVIGLSGFVLFFLSGSPSVVWVGLAASALLLVFDAAPTRRSLEREQEQLLADGHAVSLVAALRSTPATPTPRPKRR